VKAPKKGAFICLKFYDLFFDSDWSEDNELEQQYWIDPDDEQRREIHPLPIVTQYGYVLEWGKRIILKTTKSSAGGEMGWYIPRGVVIEWRPAKP